MLAVLFKGCVGHFNKPAAGHRAEQFLTAPPVETASCEDLRVEATGCHAIAFLQELQDVHDVFLLLCVRVPKRRAMVAPGLQKSQTPQRWCESAVSPKYLTSASMRQEATSQ